MDFIYNVTKLYVYIASEEKEKFSIGKGQTTHNFSATWFRADIDAII